MIIVTGGAGFIGSNIVKKLNQMSRTDIMVVDDMSDGEKIKNLSDCVIADYLDKSDFLHYLSKIANLGDIEIIFHQGACSDTMEADGKYILENNFTYSKSLHQYCQLNKIPFIYASSASVYGGGVDFTEHPANETPLNAYAYSKLVFDQYVRQNTSSATSQVVGLRYFNVYGPREQHKGRMASVAYHFHKQYLENQQVKLFQGCDGYADGAQVRDFVSVDDVIDVNLFFMNNRNVSGIFNVGTGRSQSFNEVACAVVNTLQEEHKSKTIGDLVRDGVIQYIAFPKALEGKYQSFTQADITSLRKAGYEKSFQTVEDGVGQYMRQLLANE